MTAGVDKRLRHSYASFFLPSVIIEQNIVYTNILPAAVTRILLIVR